MDNLIVALALPLDGTVSAADAQKLSATLKEVLPGNIQRLACPSYARAACEAIFRESNPAIIINEYAEFEEIIPTQQIFSLLDTPSSRVVDISQIPEVTDEAVDRVFTLLSEELQLGPGNISAIVFDLVTINKVVRKGLGPDADKFLIMRAGDFMFADGTQVKMCQDIFTEAA